MSHVRCFQWLGGVPELVVPDNLKSATSRACKYDPDVNPTYQQMLEHYNVAVLPARPRKPKDKAKAEVGVQVVERWIMARIRHEIFYSLASLNQRIRELLERLNNKIMQKLGYSRAELFIQLDKPALKPLPEASYSYTLVKKVRVHADYHVEIDKHYYSVPCSLLGQQLEAWISGELVRLFNQGQEVAVHPRKRTYGYSTRNEHMPEAHRQHATRTPERLLEWAGHIGSETHSYVLHILNSRPHPEQSYRFCLGLLNLHKKYSKARLNAACARALKTKVWRLSGIKSIRKKVWINNLFRIQNQICYPRWNTKTYAAVSITTDTGSMMNHLYEQLTALKLTGFRDALKKQLAQPGTYRELGFEERLSLLTAEELTCRENRKAERLIKHARFRLNAELSKLDYRNNRGLDRALIRSLSQGNWLTLKQNILLTGATGSGKTFLACALGHNACRQGYKVYYYRLKALMEQCYQGHADGRYSKLLTGLNNSDLLLLDDWGLEPLSSEQRSDLLEIVDLMYQRGSIIVVSQLPVENWYKMIGDSTHADAILDRLVHGSIKIELKGESMRKIQSPLTEGDQ